MAKKKRKRPETEYESLNVSQGPSVFESSYSQGESLASQICRVANKIPKMLPKFELGQKSLSDINFLTPEELAGETQRRRAPNGLVKAPQYRYRFVKNNLNPDHRTPVN